VVGRWGGEVTIVRRVIGKRAGADPIPARKDKTMKWMLVVLVGGMTPVSTNLVFDKFSECLAAEEQMRQHYIDAFDAWDRSAAVSAERRRDYRRARDMQAKRLLGNVGTCVPYADDNQPQIVTPQQPAAPPTSQPIPQPSPRT
jgi:hypothetical protein